MADSRDTKGGKLTRRHLTQRLARYGFTECCTLQCFLKTVCNDCPGPSEWLYIGSKLEECLVNHDNGSAWFADLRALKAEVGRIARFSGMTRCPCHYLY